MKTSLILLTLFILAQGSLLRADSSCGDDGIICGGDEHCCEHVIAMFSDDHASAPPYVQGQCIPKDAKCSEFWCGNRECTHGFCGSPSVCCINTPEGGGTPQYSCAFSELNCPGNAQQ